ncbi:MAG: CoA pyrophosphatase [Deltaproteobacteria bacterium]|nr:CoA pyrophosphatase [Deltaproteobacteria bacterium]
MTGRSKTVLPRDGMITAAVLVPLFSRNGEPHVLMTKRSDLVEHHKGEISFPGGKLDPEDLDLKSCALRETEEEIGIDPRDVRIVGELDDFYTVATNYLVVPFVGVIPYPYEFRPSSREIDTLLGVPLRIFFDPQRRTEETWIIRGQSVEVVSYLWEGHNIWGATARILKHFVEILSDGLSQKNLHAPAGQNPQ